MNSVSKLNNLDQIVNFFIGPKPEIVEVLIDDFVNMDEIHDDQNVAEQYKKTVKDESLLWHNNVPLPY